MTKKIYIQDSSEFKLSKTNLYNLYTGGSTGVDTKASTIDRATGFLQRLAQQTSWQENEGAKAKEYIGSLLKGSNLLDSFVLVPAKLLLMTVDERIKSTTGEVQEAWVEVKEFLEKRVSYGVKQFVIDGQNRLFESILPFFNNDLRLPETQSFVFVTVDEETGDIEQFDARGRLFEDLPIEIQNWIKEIKIPIAIGTKGDLERFCDTLIWKNEGIAWDDWQKMITRNWFTKYLRQIRILSDKDKSNPEVTALLSKVAGKTYEYDRNGWDKLVSELLMWMVRGVESSSLSEVKQFFDGNFKVTKTQIELLQTYLIEFSNAYSKVWPNGLSEKNRKKVDGITNTELRNYVYLRYVIDNPKSDKFEKVAVPFWKINQGVKFAVFYKKYNKILMDKPENLGALPSRTFSKTKVGGKKLSAKTPGAYSTLNGQYDMHHIAGRLEILLSVLAGRKPETKHIFNELVKTNVISVLATDKTPSMAQIHENNPFTPDGEEIDIVYHDDTSLFDIGHITPKSKGGSNKDVVLQKKSPNRKLQDNPIPA